MENADIFVLEDNQPGWSVSVCKFCFVFCAQWLNLCCIGLSLPQTCSGVKMRPLQGQVWNWRTPSLVVSSLALPLTPSIPQGLLSLFLLVGRAWLLLPPPCHFMRKKKCIINKKWETILFARCISSFWLTGLTCFCLRLGPQWFFKKYFVQIY